MTKMQKLIAANRKKHQTEEFEKQLFNPQQFVADLKKSKHSKLRRFAAEL